MKIIRLALYILPVVLILGACGSSKKVSSKKGKSEEPEVKQTDMQTIKYIAKFKRTAQREMREYGIPASITMAQGILESAAGTSYLARTANNHFGIKCGDDWTGPKVFKDDDHKNECFRKYKSPEESYRDHSEFLAKRRRYAFLFRFSPSDYEAWAKGLKKAGYATDPSYPSKLIYLIEKYDLHALDKEVLAQMNVKTKEPAIKKSGEDHQKIIYEVKAGETLYTIAKKFGIPVSEIKELNNLVDFDIYEGQILVLKLPKDKIVNEEEPENTKQETTATEPQPVQIQNEENTRETDKVSNEPSRREIPESPTVTNKNKETQKFILHTVQAKETLYSLAKKYGTTVDKIKQANNLVDNQLSIGQVLRIPVSEKSPAAAQDNRQTLPAYHIVQPGETLYRIHIKYGIPIEKLRELNNLPDNTIHPGQKLRLR